MQKIVVLVVVLYVYQFIIVRCGKLWLWWCIWWKLFLTCSYAPHAQAGKIWLARLFIFLYVHASHRQAAVVHTRLSSSLPCRRHHLQEVRASFASTKWMMSTWYLCDAGIRLPMPYPDDVHSNADTMRRHTLDCIHQMMFAAAGTWKRFCSGRISSAVHLYGASPWYIARTRLQFWLKMNRAVKQASISHNRDYDLLLARIGLHNLHSGSHSVIHPYTLR